MKKFIKKYNDLSEGIVDRINNRGNSPTVGTMKDALAKHGPAIRSASNKGIRPDSTGRTGLRTVLDTKIAKKGNITRTVSAESLTMFGSLIEEIMREAFDLTEANSWSKDGLKKSTKGLLKPKLNIKAGGAIPTAKMSKATSSKTPLLKTKSFKKK